MPEGPRRRGRGRLQRRVKAHPMQSGFSRAWCPISRVFCEKWGFCRVGRTLLSVAVDFDRVERKLLSAALTLLLVLPGKGTASTGCGKMVLSLHCEFSVPCCAGIFGGIGFVFVFANPVPACFYPAAGASKRCMRRRFSALAANWNIHSTRRRPRNLVCRIPAACFIHPNTCSTRLRFR